jgi:hypothetical protein
MPSCCEAPQERRLAMVLESAYLMAMLQLPAHPPVAS